jgi:16S rRNA (cytidine1402-2'-O)-methyltransferase
MTAGRLILIPTWLSESVPVEACLPATTLEAARSLTLFFVENAKSARAFLKAAGTPHALRDIALHEFARATVAEIDRWLDRVAQGQDAGLLSEAGAPCIADPGSGVVARAHARGIAVLPLVGPSAMTLALMASGLNGQRYRFLGYLPADATARAHAIRESEAHSRRHDETQLAIETPYRGDTLLAALIATLTADCRLVVAAHLTAPDARVIAKPVRAWRQKSETLGKVPAMFLWQH